MATKFNISEVTISLTFPYALSIPGMMPPDCAPQRAAHDENRHEKARRDALWKRQP